MKFGFEDREYAFDSTLTVEEGIILKEKAGLGVNEVDHALQKGYADAVAAWVFILKRRAGEAIRWQDLLKRDILTFRIIPDEVADAQGDTEVPSAAAPDPTSLAGKTRKRATSST
jgi:hypothetical protein